MRPSHVTSMVGEAKKPVVLGLFLLPLTSATRCRLDSVRRGVMHASLPHENTLHDDSRTSHSVGDAPCGVRVRSIDEQTVGPGVVHSIYVLAAPIMVRCTLSVVFILMSCSR